MKYIITESQNARIRLLRRTERMKEMIDDFLNSDLIVNSQEEYKFVPFNYFLQTMSNTVGIEMAREANITDNDEFVTFRNQVKQYVSTNFYEYLKDFWNKYQ